MQQELDIDDLVVTVDPASCLEVSRAVAAAVKSTVQTVTDILLAVLSHM